MGRERGWSESGNGEQGGSSPTCRPSDMRRVGAEGTTPHQHRGAHCPQGRAWVDWLKRVKAAPSLFKRTDWSWGILLLVGYEFQRAQRKCFRMWVGVGQTRGYAEHYLGVTDVNRYRGHSETGSSGFKADEGEEAMKFERE